MAAPPMEIVAANPPMVDTNQILEVQTEIRDPTSIDKVVTVIMTTDSHTKEVPAIIEETSKDRTRTTRGKNF